MNNSAGSVYFNILRSFTCGGVYGVERKAFSQKCEPNLFVWLSEKMVLWKLILISGRVYYIRSQLRLSICSLAVQGLLGTMGRLLTLFNHYAGEGPLGDVCPSSRLNSLENFSEFLSISKYV